ncbi:acyltransferase domain-containing protein, partial [Kibdelosporangium lantanae]
TFEHRAAVVGANRADLRAGLVALSLGESHSDLVTGTVSARGGDGVVFVFPGQGSQWVGMGRGLWDVSAAFRQRLAECDRALSPLVGFSVVDVVRSGSDLDRVEVVQPVLFAVMVALAEVWVDAGVTPAAVIGHSQGEVAAACVAGLLSLEDAARVVAVRSRLLGRLRGVGGGMASVSLSVDEVEDLLGSEFGGAGLSVAAVNGPRSVVVSGNRRVLEKLTENCASRGVRARLVDVDYASHHGDVDVVEEDLVRALEGVRSMAGSGVVMWSTVSAGVVDGADLDGGYWFRNLRDRVRFDEVVRGLVGEGFRSFVEVSPHPVLLPGIEDVFDAAGVSGVVCESVRRGDDGLGRLLLSLGRGWVHGAPVSWRGTVSGGGLVDLPTYPFQHERYWLDGISPVAAEGTDSDDEHALWDAIERRDTDELSAILGVEAEETAGLSDGLSALSTWRRQRRERSTLDGWRYRQIWRSVPSVRAEPPRGRWLVVVPEGHENRLVPTSSGFDAEVISLGATADSADVELVVGTAVAGREFAGVLSLLALGAGGHPELETGLMVTAILLRTLKKLGVTTRLWCATQGAVAKAGTERLRNPAQTQLWGLGRAAAVEYPDLWGGLVDLPARLDERTWTLMAAAVTNS